MPMGHLMVGLTSGLLALVVGLLTGMSFWAAVLLYVGVGNLCVLASAALQLWFGRRRPPPPRRQDRTAPGAKKVKAMRVIH